MITVTENAAQELKAVLAANAPDSNQVFRLHIDGSECSLGLDLKREDDDVVKSDGVVILVMTPEVSLAFANATIDCVHTPEGVCLTIHTGEQFPHEDTGCGHDCSCH